MTPEERREAQKRHRLHRGRARQSSKPLSPGHRRKRSPLQQLLDDPAVHLRPGKVVDLRGVKDENLAKTMELTAQAARHEEISAEKVVLPDLQNKKLRNLNLDTGKKGSLRFDRTNTNNLQLTNSKLGRAVFAGGLTNISGSQGDIRIRGNARNLQASGFQGAIDAKGANLDGFRGHGMAVTFKGAPKSMNRARIENSTVSGSLRGTAAVGLTAINTRMLMDVEGARLGHADMGSLANVRGLEKARDVTGMRVMADEAVKGPVLNRLTEQGAEFGDRAASQIVRASTRPGTQTTTLYQAINMPAPQPGSKTKKQLEREAELMAQSGVVQTTNTPVQRHNLSVRQAMALYPHLYPGMHGPKPPTEL